MTFRPLQSLADAYNRLTHKNVPLLMPTQQDKDLFLLLPGINNSSAIKRHLRKFGKNIVNTQSANGDTAALFAAANGRVYILQLLITAGADLNLANSSGISPLICAFMNGREEAAMLLLKSDTDINHQDSTSRTALMYAAASPWDWGVQPLLEAGADISIRTHDGLSAIDFALRSTSRQHLEAWEKSTLQRQEDAQRLKAAELAVFTEGTTDAMTVKNARLKLHPRNLRVNHDAR